MNILRKKLVVGTVLTVIASIGLATSAAAVSTAPVRVKTNVPTVNLTSAQQQMLQAEVNEQLKNYGGGKQVGINQIAYDNDQLILTLPLPGEKKARAIDEPMTPEGVANCAFTHACLWSDTNFNGSRIDRVNCDFITLSAPFNSSTASIHNNQTTGTQTVILNSSRQILNASLAPSRINDTGVGSRGNARFWDVC